MTSLALAAPADSLSALATALAAQPWRSAGAFVLAVWLLGAMGAWGWRRAAAGRQSARALAITGVAGAAALLSWLALAGAGPQGGGLVGRFDEALLHALAQGVSPLQLQPWAWLTHAGDARSLSVLAALVAALLWRQGDRTGLLVWLGGLAGNGLSTRALKAVVERPRPMHEHGLAVVESGSGFPSGHASAALVAWGLLAWLLARRLAPCWHGPVALVAAAVVVLVGWSRVLLQVHHASDVLAGWLLGAAWLVACLLAAERLAAWSARTGRGPTT